MRYVVAIFLVVWVLFAVIYVRSESGLGVKRVSYTMYKYELYDVFRRKAGEDFEKEWNQTYSDDPIAAKYDPIGGNYPVKLNAEVVAGTLQDIFFVPDFNEYARRGVLLDLTPYVEKHWAEPYLKEIYPALIEAHKVDGKLYGLPNNLNTTVLYYNRNLFDRADIPYPDADWDWNRMLDAAGKLTRRDAKGRLIQAGLIPGTYREYRFMILWNGGRFWNADGTKAVVDSPEARQALEFLRDLRWKHQVCPSPADLRDASGSAMFRNNRAAMLIGGRWWTAVFKGLSDVDWAVAPLPKSFKNRRPAYMTFNSLGINANTRYPDLAFKLLLHLTSREQIEELVDVGDSIPIRHGEAANVHLLADKTRPKDENRAYLINMDDALTERVVFTPLVPKEELQQLMKRFEDGFSRSDANVATLLTSLQKDLQRRCHEHMQERTSPSVGAFAVAMAVIAGIIVVLLWRFRRQALSAEEEIKPLQGQRTRAGYLYLLPNFAGVLVFALVPVTFSLMLSFCEWNLLTWPPRFVGVENFARLLHDEDFWLYTFNTIFFMLGVPIGMVCSLLLAMLLNQKLRLRNLYRTVFFLPSFTAGVALCMMWKWLLNTDHGLINMSLMWLGDLFGANMSGPDWLGHRWAARFAFILMGFWTGIGRYNMILYLAALQGINPELYEAADIDGAGWWARFRYIVWPLVSPTTFFIFIISIIYGFQSGFEAVYILARETPVENAVTTINYYIYSNAYQFYRMGYASSIAWFLFILVFTFTLLNWRYVGKRVHYG